jgi:hypothetical protein
MKNFTKLFGGILLAFVMASVSQAASLPRTPKETFVTPFSVAGSSVSASTWTAVDSRQFPGAVYQVVLSTGASGEYIVMFDSNVCTGLGPTTVPTAPAQQVGPRLLFGSTSANSSTPFDPPLMFHNGLCVFDSAATGQASITWEPGRGLSGN